MVTEVQITVYIYTKQIYCINSLIYSNRLINVSLSSLAQISSISITT